MTRQVSTLQAEESEELREVESYFAVLLSLASGTATHKGLPKRARRHPASPVFVRKRPKGIHTIARGVRWHDLDDLYARS